MVSITLYAELLLNIRQVTVVATLPSSSNKNTKVEISESCTAIIVHHEEETVALSLPCQVLRTGILEIPKPPSSELSFRLPFDKSVLLTKMHEEDFALTQWSAKSLGSRTRIACKSCGYIWIDSSISSWRDLPSENWAEMMDFWHCHKPEAETNGHSNGHVTGKGYAADRRIAAQPGIAFVDVLHFQVHPDDCSGLEVSTIFINSSICSVVRALRGLAERKRPAPFMWTFFATSTIQLPESKTQRIPRAMSRNLYTPKNCHMVSS